MVNPYTQIAYSLGEGASSSVVVRDIEILNQEYFNSILYVRDEQTVSKRKAKK